MKKYKLFLIALLGIICAFALSFAVACSGSDGTDGIGIVSVEKGSSSGSTDTYIITYSDGSTSTFVVTNGTNGTDGTTITSFTPAYDTDGTTVLSYTVKFSDGKEFTIYNGTNGNDGTIITSLTPAYDTDGTTVLSYTVKFSDGKEFTIYNGTNGKSAYELYVETYGYTGTLAEWLEDLANGNLATVSYTVTFNTEGAGEIASQTVNKGDKVTEPETPTLTGYELEGWYLNGEKWSYIGYTVTEDITLTAKWVLKNSGLTFTAVYDTEDTEKIVSYTVSGYSGSDTEIEIPEYYNGYPVTAINASVFAGKTSITSITIPDSVTTIGANAFDSCTNLTTVTLPAGITTLGSQAFASSAKISNVYYKGDLAGWLGITFGSGTANPTCYSAALYFTNTDSEYTLVESVTITGVTAINSCAFYGCGSLKSVTIGADVTSIGDYAFKECANLATVTTQGTSTLETIGTESFYDCASLTSVVIPDSVTTIGTNTFYDCWSLTGVYYNGTASEWASITFDTAFSNPLYYAGNLYLNETLVTDITLENITKINRYVFYGSTSLTSVTISDGVTSIGYSAFYKCTKLTSVTIPDSVTSVSNYAFSECTLLEYTEYENGYYLGNDTNKYIILVGVKDTTAASFTINANTKVIYYQAFVNCSSLTSITIPDSVISISNTAFYCCTSLTSITIGSGVTSIDSGAFSNCTKLTAVYYNGTSAGYSNITISPTSNSYLTNAKWYYYAEKDSTTEAGNYWYYDGDTIVIWTVEDNTQAE